MVSINETEWSKKTLYKFFKQTFRDFLPLPVNTNVLVKTIELPDKNKEIHSYDPALVNIFIDPKEFSKEEFEEFSRCVKDNIEMLNNFVSKTPNFTGSRFGGLAYITGSALLSMIHTMSADGKLVNGFETDFMGTVWEEGVYGGDVFNGGVNWLRQKAPQRGDNSLNPFSQ